MWGGNGYDSPQSLSFRWPGGIGLSAPLFLDGFTPWSGLKPIQQRGGGLELRKPMKSDG